jgi:UDP-N-acetylmuramoyl-tripeptide--D-alanyl-D-alanine ligase
MGTPIPKNRAAFSLEQAADVTGGRALVGGGIHFRGISIDSRAVSQGELFVALRGDRHDGHDHLDEAIANGASCVMVEHAVDVGDGVGVLHVESTKRALGDLARAHRQGWFGTVIGVTGSVGKTLTKNLIEAGMAASGARVYASPGNLNNHIGVPMSLLTLTAGADVAVVEMGTSGPGEIARLCEIAEPSIGVVTSVRAAHTAGLGTIRDVGEEKAALLRSLREGGVAVYNADDEALRLLASGIDVERRVTFGRHESAHVRLRGYSVDSGLRTRVRLTIGADPTELDLRLRLLGEPAAVCAAAAMATVVAARGDVGRAVRAFERVPPNPGRLYATRRDDQTIVIDDSYNSSPSSARAAIDTAVEVAGAEQRVVLIMGDMKELGDLTDSAHTELGRHAAAAGVAVLVAVGPDMALAAKAAEAAGVEVHAVETARLALPFLRVLLSAGDVVLVKGSRSMEMEQIVDALLPKGGQAA